MKSSKKEETIETLQLKLRRTRLVLAQIHKAKARHQTIFHVRLCQNYFPGLKLKPLTANDLIKVAHEELARVESVLLAAGLDPQSIE